MQLFYSIPEGVELSNSAGKLAPGVDIRGEGGQVVFPGSIHPDTGAAYTWLEGRSPEEIDMEPLPAWIIADLTKPAHVPAQARPQRMDINYSSYINSAMKGEAEKVKAAVESTRNATTNASAYALGRLAHAGLQRSDAETDLTNAAMDAGLSEREAGITFASGWEAGIKNPRVIPEQDHVPTNGKRKKKAPPPDTGDRFKETGGERFSDYAHVIRLREKHGGEIAHSTGLDWMWFTGSKWEPDVKRAIDYVSNLGADLRDIEGPAMSGDDPELIKKYYQAARHLQRNRTAHDVLDLASCKDPFNIDPKKWDGDPYLVNFLNGTLDLRLGELRPHDPEDYLTQQIPHKYDPDATCPRWIRFMQEVFDGDQALIDFIRWSLGYAFSGLTTYHVFYVLHGMGANGKSTFLDTVAHVLGDYATSLNPEELMQQKSSAHPTGMMGLRGARFVQAQETTQGRRLNESLVKNMTGGDRMSARKLYSDYVEFKPQFKLWMGTNHLPEVNDDSGAMWRRIRAVPFTQTFKGKDADPDLGTALKAEAAGIISWAMSAFINCQAEPDPLPNAVLAATAEYRSSQDTIAEFLETMTDSRNPSATVERRALYDAFLTFSGGKGESIKSFNERMKMHGFYEIRTDSGGKTQRSWRGLKLRNAD